MAERLAKIEGNVYPPTATSPTEKGYHVCFTNYRAKHEYSVKRLLAITATLAAMAIPAVASAMPALATQQQITATGGQDGNGDAMNNWFGMGAVYQYTANKGNEDFAGQDIGRCGGGASVTSTCPFTQTGKDNALLGNQIIQIYYESDSDGCIGVNSSVDPGLERCNSVSNGSGGGLWTVFVIANNDSLVSVGATNGTGDWVQLDGNGTSNRLSFDEGETNPTVWSGD